MSTITDKPVYIYNTLTRKRELFQPLNPPGVGIYSCGPTVYKDIHVGNFRTFMMTDWLRRMLEYNGYDVYLVRNITDVGHLQNDDVESGEDKLEYEARTTGRSAYDIAQRYTEQYMRDAAELNILPPHLSPKATDHIGEMLEMTQALVEKGLAYIADGNVYYDVAHFPEYGKLSGNTVENLRAGGHGREQMEVAEDKRSPEDFALWKKGDEGRQMNWGSPWGSGFPGWHIECSAMATKYLGEQFDIHTGGLDLMFPHHEDEIAQSQGTFGKEPVKYWVHGEFLIIGNRKMKASNENGDDSIKMSRSKGNVLLVSTLKEEGIDPMAFRYLMLTAHYRSKINYTDDSIQAAQNALNNLRDDLAELPITEQTANWSEEAQRVRDAFREAINNDLDLPTALVLTRETVRNAKIEPAERRHLVLDFDRVLGLRLDTVEPKKPLEISDEVKEIVRQRDEARAAKNWKRSDQLRDELKALGFEVRDTPRGTELA
ncbi:cysteine--tRNA ligase [Ktedonobacter racemifer]|uniref:Cysteine--tRNA ligase n=1 Tax=Ktedonobacter racemifer DSM 44963 TaxID=485913 RepID=D6TJN5_KTERA|nr:cysteine--tRNA ligase [Ktedonobacter racemifer]EFH89642.1 cysteinyl-tRNA synthetase [Ktedonobacter racemifer DSM 44963]